MSNSFLDDQKHLRQKERFLREVFPVALAISDENDHA